MQQKRSMIFLVALYMQFKQKNVLSPKACTGKITGQVGGSLLLEGPDQKKTKT